MVIFGRCKSKKLQNTLNVHPAGGKITQVRAIGSIFLSLTHTGIEPWESAYKDIAKAMGIDPSVSAIMESLVVGKHVF